MRQVALIAVLAQTGSFVPAARARVEWSTPSHARGAADDLARGRARSWSRWRSARASSTRRRRARCSSSTRWGGGPARSMASPWLGDREHLHDQWVPGRSSPRTITSSAIWRGRRFARESHHGGDRGRGAGRVPAQDRARAASRSYGIQWRGSPASRRASCARGGRSWRISRRRSSMKQGGRPSRRARQAARAARAVSMLRRRRNPRPKLRPSRKRCAPSISREPPRWTRCSGCMSTEEAALIPRLSARREASGIVALSAH